MKDPQLVARGVLLALYRFASGRFKSLPNDASMEQILQAAEGEVRKELNYPATLKPHQRDQKADEILCFRAAIADERLR